MFFGIATALYASQDAERRERLKVLGDGSLDYHFAISGEEMIRSLTEHFVEVLLCDYEILGEEPIVTLSVIQETADEDTAILILVHELDAEVESILTSVPNITCLRCPCEAADLRIAVAKALESIELVKANRNLSECLQKQGSLVAERKSQLERENTQLRMAEKAVRDILESLPVALVVVDQGGAIAWVNGQTEELFGYTREQFIGEKAELLIPDRFLGRYRENLSRYFESPQRMQIGGEDRLFAKRSDGTEFPVEIELNSVLMPKGRLLVGLVSDITCRLEAAETLRLSEERFRLAMLGSNDGLWDWNLVDGKVFFAQRWKRMLGFGDNEVGDRIDEFWDRIHEDDIRLVHETFEAYRSGKTPSFEVELRLQHKDGHYISALSRGFGERDAEGRLLRMVGTNVDVTPYKNVLEDLHRKNRAVELHHLVARASTIACDLEEVLRITLDKLKDQGQWAIGRLRLEDDVEVPSQFKRAYWGTARGKRLRVFRDALDDRTISTALDARQGVIQEDCNVWSPEFSELSDEVARDAIKDAGLRSVQCFPVLINGELIAVMEFYRYDKESPSEDLLAIMAHVGSQLATEIRRRQAEAELQQMNEDLERRVKQRTSELEEAWEVAEAANRAKSSFLANMSHEIRTPMNAIMGFSQLMQRDRLLNSEQRENLTAISRSGEHLMTVINDVLEMSKIEAGRITLNPVTFDLRALIDDLGIMFRGRVENKKLRYESDAEEGLPQFVVSDESKLRQVLINLLGNAVKFTQEGRVMVRVGRVPESEKDSDVASDGIRLFFEVHDSGVGIAPEDQDKLFNKFEQANNQIAAEGGTGLGLAISRRYAQLMGGDITLTSELGKGSVFRFEIAAGLGDDREMLQRSQRGHVSSVVDGANRFRVLVADDRATNRDVLCRLLGEIGFDLREVANGQEAVDQWRQWSPHLILMDMAMPVMDGYEASRQIKVSDTEHKTVVIAITAGAFETERAKIMALGVDDLVLKPYNEAILLDRLGFHLGLEYVYSKNGQKDESDGGGEKEALSVERVEQLPADLREKMTSAIQIADVEALNGLLQELSETDADIAEGLMTLANQFQYDELIRLLGGACEATVG